MSFSYFITRPGKVLFLTEKMFFFVFQRPEVILEKCNLVVVVVVITAYSASAECLVANKSHQIEKHDKRIRTRA